MDKDFLDRMRLPVDRSPDHGGETPVERVVNMLRSKGLEGIAEPVLRFRTSPMADEQPPNGSTMFGGSPDLPQDVLWPAWQGRPLDFLLQLNCGDIPKRLKDPLLPKRGWLYFFYDMERNPRGHDPAHGGCCRVLFCSGNRRALVRWPRPGSLSPSLNPCRVTFFEGIHVNWRSVPDQKWDSDLDLDWRDSMCAAMRDIAGHQIMGHAEGVQNSHEHQQEICEVASQGEPPGCCDPDVNGTDDSDLKRGIKDWRLLLKLGSDNNADLFGNDHGALHFWIREQDLRKADFDNVWTTFECF